MSLQFVHDHKGNTTGIFIPIEEWQSLKTKYSDLQTEEVNAPIELADWQKQILDERLNDYYQNADDVANFNDLLDNIEKNL